MNNSDIEPIILDKETLFILGAGASKPYGLPLGNELKSILLSNLSNNFVKKILSDHGFECSVGIMQRPERTILLAVGAITSKLMLIMAIWIIAILSNVTAIYRIIHIHQKDREKTNENI